MNEDTSQNNAEEKKEVVIPPEPPKIPEVQSGFDSPILFKKEENLPTSQDEQSKVEPVHNKKKVVISILAGVIVLSILIVSMIQILVESKFETVNPNDFTPVSSEDFVFSEEENDPSQNTLCENGPFVKVVSPNKDSVFTVGDSVTFEWELCGIGTSLFSKAVIDYFDPETGTKEGTFSLHCVAPVIDKGQTQQIVWTIPDFLEVHTNEYEKRDCLLPVVNFLESHTYKLSVIYANNSYSSQSEFFEIEKGEYVYVPPKFEDYSITPVSVFERSPFIDSSAPEFLKEVIFPAYFEAPSLFANYYRTYVIPAGPSYIIDLRDGNVYPSPQTYGQVVTKPFSRLYITEEPLGSDPKYKGRTHRVSWNLFEESTKDFELLFKRICSIETGAINHTYNDCIPES